MYLRSSSKRKWSEVSRGAEPATKDDISEEDPASEEDSEEEDFQKLDVDTLDDVLIIVEECSEMLNLVHNFLSTQHLELAQFLPQSLTQLRRLQSSVSQLLVQHTNTTSSKNALSPIGTPKTIADPLSQDNTFKE